MTLATTVTLTPAGQVVVMSAAARHTGLGVPGPHVLHMAKLTVWYDADCPLCRREIQLMRRLDRTRAITFIDVTRSEGQCPIDPGELLARFHAEENGRLFSGAEAFAALWRAIPLLRPLGLLARNRLVLSLLERSYIRFLAIRPQLQGWARRWSTSDA